MVPFDLTLYLRFVQTPQIIVHLADMSGIHVAAAAYQVHAALRRLTGKAAHELWIDPRQIAMPNALKIAPIGHERELNLACLNRF